MSCKRKIIEDYPSTASRLAAVLAGVTRVVQHEQLKKERRWMHLPRRGLRIRLRVLAPLLALCGLLVTQTGSPALAASSSSAPFNTAQHSLAVGATTTLPGGFRETLLAKAQPDECFDEIGLPYPAPLPDGSCPTGSQKKVNQAYVWGLARASDTFWFGTAPNVHCLVIGGYLGVTAPIKTSSYVCEFGSSYYAKTYSLPPTIGDWRPPHIYTYNLATKKLTDKSGVFGSRLNYTLGIRSAGTLNGVVFLAGPSLLQGGKSIDVYAFSATTGGALGVWNLPQYDNIRKWLVVNGALYTAVHNTAGGGSVLRWTGKLPAAGDLNPASTLFETVGALDADGAELALYKGRIFVSTWPDLTRHTVAGLWMSPVIPKGGLTNANAAGWRQVWTVNDYEPDPVTAATYGGGALMSFGGQLYWGTMHVPMVATLAHLQVYGQPQNTQEALADIANTWRAVAIFRGKDFGTAKQRVQLLYGEKRLPAYAPSIGWSLQPTKAGAPLYGHSGFGNPFNNYTWTMGVYKEQLFVGTMDWSYLFPDMVQGIASYLGGTPLTTSQLRITLPMAGADLYRFSAPDHAATAISTNGLGNLSSYGIRTMMSSSDGLYLGMANPMNLLTTPGKPMGGWELIRVR